ncbi:MAG TPA: hypothetical protein VKE70_04015 [Candidatus Solibacter sp.]|nr:hypothetical protein [Candidatus Solibacter sp.]
MQVPTIVTSSVLSLVAGAAIGVVTMFWLGYDPRKELTGGTGENAPATDGAKGGPPGKGKGGGPGGAPGKGKGGGGPGGPAGKGKGGPAGGLPNVGGAMMSGMGPPNPKIELVNLIKKLDQLTTKPLSVTLSDDQRAKLGEQLKGLTEADQLSEADAKKRLDAILEIMKEHKETLEAAGFRWPDTAGGPPRPPEMPANPFSEGENQNHLKNLEKYVGKSKPK